MLGRRFINYISICMVVTSSRGCCCRCCYECTRESLILRRINHSNRSRKLSPWFCLAYCPPIVVIQSRSPPASAHHLSSPERTLSSFQLPPPSSQHEGQCYLSNPHSLLDLHPAKNNTISPLLTGPPARLQISFAAYRRSEKE